MELELNFVGVVPASAGVILDLPQTKIIAFGRSRECGGDPAIIFMVGNTVKSFPRVRG